MKLLIETHLVKGSTDQLSIKKSWDGSYYFEIGADWTPVKGFGHPQPGRHIWQLRDGRLQQTIPGIVCCHYPITVNANIAAKLVAGNAA